MRVVTVSIVAAALLVSSNSAARARESLVPPVSGAVLVPFDPPEHRYAPGHRGVDFAAGQGEPVRAAAAGIVSFAGRVGSATAVTVDHPSGIATTYSDLASVDVRFGDRVAEGDQLGTVGAAHHGGGAGVHLGVKVGDTYVDPAAFLLLDTTGAFHLAPLVWQPPRSMPVEFRSAFARAGTAERACEKSPPLADLPGSPPNENVAVAVAGISSRTKGGLSADMYEHGPEELGYPAHRVYRFSYAGTRGPRLHQPYRSADTYADIDRAAGRLGDLLQRIALRHPGASVDLVAHSMGGLVARRFLVTAAKSELRFPRVEHLVTFSTPHRGASAASLVDKLDEKTAIGGSVLDRVSDWARSGGPVPDPRSVAVQQLSPGSSFLRSIASERLVYGTRALTLAIPHDAIVTADRASWPEATARVVPPEGLEGHSAVVSSDVAQGLAYSFLRDAPPSCTGFWDVWGPRVGRGIGLAEGNLHLGVAAWERVVGTGPLSVVGRAVGRLVTPVRIP